MNAKHDCGQPLNIRLYAPAWNSIPQYEDADGNRITHCPGCGRLIERIHCAYVNEWQELGCDRHSPAQQ